MPDPFVEEAFMICRGPDGLVAGNVVTGGPHSVAFPVHCPVGTVAVAPFHNHPGDSSGQPSQADVRETLRRGFNVTCVGHQGAVYCWDLVK